MTETYQHFTNSLNQTYCSLRYLEHDNMLTLIWKGTAPEESFQSIRDSMVQMLHAHKCQIILNDVQQLFSAPAEVLRDLGDLEWDRLIATLGVKALVHVLKPETEIPIQPENEASGMPLVKYFHSKFDAIEWVKTYLRNAEDQA